MLYVRRESPRFPPESLRWPCQTTWGASNLCFARVASWSTSFVPAFGLCLCTNNLPTKLLSTCHILSTQQYVRTYVQNICFPFSSLCVWLIFVEIFVFLVIFNVHVCKQVWSIIQGAVVIVIFLRFYVVGCWVVWIFWFLGLKNFWRVPFGLVVSWSRADIYVNPPWRVPLCSSFRTYAVLYECTRDIRENVKTRRTFIPDVFTQNTRTFRRTAAQQQQYIAAPQVYF